MATVAPCRRRHFSGLAQQLDASAAAVEAVSGDFKPDVAMILGSGLGVMAEAVNPTGGRIDYGDIPHMAQSTVEGHSGELVLGELGGRNVAVLSGRVHAYEGHPFNELVYPLRLMARLGCKTMVVTNAAGGINTDFVPGDIMLITDHINMLGSNPLIGPNEDSLGPRFPDMSTAYDPELRKHALEAAAACQVELKQGVYLAALGPSYETPAEIRMMRGMG
jgi:purine-nucleoside phosphorylase